MRVTAGDVNETRVHLGQPGGCSFEYHREPTPDTSCRSKRGRRITLFHLQSHCPRHESLVGETRVRLEMVPSAVRPFGTGAGETLEKKQANGGPFGRKLFRERLFGICATEIRRVT